jgi:hypothetical protein
LNTSHLEPLNTKNTMTFGIWLQLFNKQISVESLYSK